MFINQYWFYYHKTFFVFSKLFSPNRFRHFCRIYQKKLLKIHVALWHHTILTSEFLYFITNHAIDVIKANRSHS